MSPLIDLELETTDRQHLQLMQLNQKLADAMQMYHFLMMSESAKMGERGRAIGQDNQPGLLYVLYCLYTVCILYMFFIVIMS